NASAATYSEQLALVSLQGIVNRESSKMYFNFDGESEKDDSLLNFLSRKHNVSLGHITFGEAFDEFSGQLNGIVVYDEKNIHTVNIATILSGIHDYVIASPELATEMSETYGLDISYDLRERPWSDLRDEVSIYDEALSSLYPLCEERLIAILTPDRLRSRDYVIATRSFVFYVPLGPMTTGTNVGFMEKVLESTPENAPILGWFPSPTGAEENFYVQMISESGKMAIGGENFPNLSVLSSFQLAEGLRQSPMRRDLELKDKVYLTISIPDGDNIDFMNQRMREIWNHDLRGSIPISWSMEPLLWELAPVFLEYLYDDATPSDTFVAGPSGAGYIYPDFIPDENLNLYLWRAKRLLNRTDIDIVWLLNSFTSYETPYSTRKLEGYAQVLRPEAIILDYGDTAVRRSYWVQSTEDGVGVPVIRSTHAWGDVDNFLGKVSMEVETLREGPHFLFVPVMPWTITLDEIVEAIDTLNVWYEHEFEVVSVHEFFNLFKRAVVVNAKTEFDDISGNPIAVGFAGGLIESARTDIQLAEEMEAQGDIGRALAHASLASGYLDEVEVRIVLISLILLILAVALTTLFFLVRKGTIRRKGRPKLGRALLVLQLLFGVSLFYLGLFHILYSNFWHYLNFVAIIVAVLVMLSLRKYVFSGRGPFPLTNVAAGACLSISSGLVLIHGLAIGFVAASLVLIFSSREDEASALAGTDYILIFLGGLVIAMVLQLQLLSIVLLSIWLIAFTIARYAIAGEDHFTYGKVKHVDEVAPPGKFALSFTTSFLLVLLLIPFVFSQNHYFSLAADFNIPLLEHLGLLALLSSILVSPLLHHAMPASVRSRSLLPLIVIYSIIWFLLFLAPSSFFLGVTVITAQLVASLAFLQAYDGFSKAGGSATTLASRHFALVVIFGFVVVMPPLSYSLYLFPLPSSVAFFLYAPPLVITAFSVFVLIPLILILHLKRTLRSESSG
ncbi:MAG: GxGYxYP domain-containing protein, partial [Thermoplasmata archaeon]